MAAKYNFIGAAVCALIVFAILAPPADVGTMVGVLAGLAGAGGVILLIMGFMSVAKPTDAEQEERQLSQQYLEARRDQTKALTR